MRQNPSPHEHQQHHSPLSYNAASTPVFASVIRTQLGILSWRFEILTAFFRVLIISFDH